MGGANCRPTDQRGVTRPQSAACDIGAYELACPSAFMVTGGGAYCAGGAGVPVGLSGSESGVDYQLVRDGATNVGSPVAGTGMALDFGNQTVAGTYTVVGSNASGCMTTMTGSAVVTVSPAATVDAGPDQTVCPTSPVMLDGTVGGGASSGMWTTSGTGNFGDANMVDTTYTPSAQDIANGSAILTLTTPTGLAAQSVTR
jgi:hypothetical protein